MWSGRFGSSRDSISSVRSIHLYYQVVRHTRKCKMGPGSGIARTWGLAVLGVVCAAPAIGQPRAIDTGRSVMTVHVYKAGLLSAFGHDHDISAPAAGTVDVAGRSVELHVEAAALRVQDAKVSDKDRA